MVFCGCVYAINRFAQDCQFGTPRRACMQSAVKDGRKQHFQVAGAYRPNIHWNHVQVKYTVTLPGRALIERLDKDAPLFRV